MPSLPLVAVLWDDAHSNDGEVDLGMIVEAHTPSPIYTYGLLLIDDEAGVTVAAEQTSPSTWRGRTFIPRGMIKEVWRVSPNPNRRSKKNRLWPEEG